jgi:CBS domain-containing protein
LKIALKEMAMLVRELMTNEVVCCTPWDTARAAASLRKKHGVGAIPVVSELSDPLLEGIVTDRDLCCGVVADVKNADAIKIWELMTPVPVTCEPECSLEECGELMQENKVRRIPVADKRERCVGMVFQADAALYAPAGQIAKMVKGISKPSKPQQNIHIEKDHFYCGQLHEQDEILLLNRRRELRREVEAVR